MTGRAITDAIFILCQLQEKYLSKKKGTYSSYFIFVDLAEKLELRSGSSQLLLSFKSLLLYGKLKDEFDV